MGEQGTEDIEVRRDKGAQADTAEAPRPYAGFWLRLVARIVDGAILCTAFVLAASVVLLMAAHDELRPVAALSVVVVVFVIAEPVYFAAWTGRTGQTPGKMLLGLRVETEGGRLPGAGRACRRALADFVFGVFQGCYVGFADPAMIVLTSDKRSLHDMVAGTVVRRVAARRAGAVIGIALLGALGTCAPPMAAIRLLPVEGIRLLSGAMRPTLLESDGLLVNRAAYRQEAPRDGDIVMFIAPPQAAVDPPKAFVKRIVGVPGDRVRVHDGRLWRNGQAVDEPYVQERIDYRWPEEGGGLTVPSGSLLVLGDNRNDSNDSHLWEGRGPSGSTEPRPFLPQDRLLGKVVGVVWPPERTRDLP